MKYSQGEEEKFLLDIFKDVTGRFLDIGAWHPTALSNTRALYERGWGGIMIEPSPGPFLNLMWACSACGTDTKNHAACPQCGCSLRYGSDPKLTLILAAVGLQGGMVRMFATDDAVSTSSEEEYERWKATANYYGEFWISVITIPDILNQFGGFHFVNIDAEGLGVELFFQLPLDAMRPRAVCVEHNGQRLIELGKFAQDHGYQQAYISQENAIYVSGG